MITYRQIELALGWIRAQGLVKMKIESQNTNVPAVRFYHKQGATLATVDESAYWLSQHTPVVVVFDIYRRTLL